MSIPLWSTSDVKIMKSDIRQPGLLEQLLVDPAYGVQVYMTPITGDGSIYGLSKGFLCP